MPSIDLDHEMFTSDISEKCRLLVTLRPTPNRVNLWPNIFGMLR